MTLKQENMVTGCKWLMGIQILIQQKKVKGNWKKKLDFRIRKKLENRISDAQSKFTQIWEFDLKKENK